jgi:predicted CXXCH cytochrome family protein
MQLFYTFLQNQCEKFAAILPRHKGGTRTFFNYQIVTQIRRDRTYIGMKLAAFGTWKGVCMLKRNSLRRFLCQFLIFSIVVPALCIIISPDFVTARVKGVCADCHTMHNSQDGSPINGEGPLEHLLVSDCVGCHSSTNANTIINDTPIAWNQAVPTQALAGGNFYWTNVDQAFGHNVEGISGTDTNFSFVPGQTLGGNTKTISECIACHSFGLSGPEYPFTQPRAGDVLICEDCHTQVQHHADDSATVVDGTGGWYRFIYDVKGIEDPDWEQTVASGDHNEYQGETVSMGSSISDAGCACHSKFHALRNPGEVGSDGQWFKHPSDVALPAGETEYAAYTTYDPEAPVARPNLSAYSGPSSTVTPGTDMVMCLSCHRPHGSPYADILRWDYSTMNAGGGGSGGCFVCHTEKHN